MEQWRAELLNRMAAVFKVRLCAPAHTGGTLRVPAQNIHGAVGK